MAARGPEGSGPSRPDTRAQEGSWRGLRHLWAPRCPRFDVNQVLLQTLVRICLSWDLGYWELGFRWTLEQAEA